MPYFCPTHQGLYVHSDSEEGCQSEACVQLRNADIPPLGMIPAIVPGGANDTAEYRFHKDFDIGLDEYRSAKQAGLQPKSTTKGAAEAAEREVYDQASALKTLDSMGADTSKLPTVKGVR